MAASGPLPAVINKRLICKALQRLTVAAKGQYTECVIEKDDLGVIIDSVVHEQQRLFNFWLRVKNQQCWITETKLRAGFSTSYKYDTDKIEVEIVDNITPEIQRHVTTSQSNNQATYFRDVLAAHLDVWKAQRAFLYQIPAWMWAIIDTEEDTTRLLAEVQQAMVVAGTTNILNNRNFNISELINLPEVTINNFKGVGGIYAIIYWDIPSQPGLAHFYMGSTYGYRRRDFEHMRDTTKAREQGATSLHYAKAMGARKRAFRVLVAHENWAPSGDVLRRRLLLEQLFINTFGSYRPEALKKGYASSKWGGGTFTIDKIGNLLSGFGEMSDLDECAATWDRISQLANKISGHQPVLTRTAFLNPSMGITRVEGLNRQSPVSYYGSTSPVFPRQWLQSTIIQPNGKRCHELQLMNEVLVQQGSTGDILTMLNLIDFAPGEDSGHVDLRIESDKDNGLITGTPVRIAAEVMLNGVHPQSFSGLSLIGPFLDWHMASAVALRISWMHKGVLMHKYCRRSRVLQLRENKNSPVGAYSGYQIGRALFRYFERQVINHDNSNHFRLGDYDFRLANVKEFNFDFYQRNVKVMNLPRNNTTMRIPSSARKRPQDLVKEMQDAGLTYVGKRYADLPQSHKKLIGHPMSPRTKCDFCLIRHLLSGHNQVCNNVLLADLLAIPSEERKGYEGIWSCEGAQYNGTPTSYTLCTREKDCAKWERWQKWNPPDESVALIARLLYRSPQVIDSYVSFGHFVQAGEKAKNTDIDIQGPGPTKIADKEDLDRLAAEYEEMKTD